MMTIGLKKITEHTTMQQYSKQGLREPPQVMTGGEAYLASIFLLELDVGTPYCWIIYGNEGQA
jgi:hypothetical protein